MASGTRMCASPLPARLPPASRRAPVAINPSLPVRHGISTMTTRTGASTSARVTAVATGVRGAMSLSIQKNERASHGNGRAAVFSVGPPTPIAVGEFLSPILRGRFFRYRTPTPPFTIREKNQRSGNPSAKKSG
jgi:hypothetical protein